LVRVPLDQYVTRSRDYSRDGKALSKKTSNTYNPDPYAPTFNPVSGKTIPFAAVQRGNAVPPPMKSRGLHISSSGHVRGKEILKVRKPDGIRHKPPKSQLH
jgi:hypothetical protein